MPRYIAGPMVAAAMLIAAVAGGGVALGQGAWHEGFEGPEPTWKDAGGNARYRIDRHERRTGEAHAGNGCERLRISGQTGTHVYISHEVGRPRVIDELSPTLWIKADRPGLQILARVVLPRTEDPRSGRPVSTLLRGTSYTRVGHWQQLRIGDIPRLLARQVRVLRMQIGSGVDAREAYVDRILLNVYGGPGVTNVWIDDLDIAGFVGPSPDPGGATPGLAIPMVASPLSPGVAPPEPAARRVELIGSVLRVDGHPIFPRAIQYRGESLARLKQLGFNTVWLSEPASRELLSEADRLGLGVVCPPPLEFRPEATDRGSDDRGSDDQGSDLSAGPPLDIGPQYAPVLAWDLGSAHSVGDPSATRQWARRIRAAQGYGGRPLLCRADSQLRAMSRYVDLLMVGRAPLATSLELTDYGTWIRERPRLARPGTTIWSTLQTQPAPTLRRQWELAGREASPPPLIQCEQIRLMAYTAIASGSRGLLFESHTSLEAADPETQSRVDAIALLNLELALIEPWLAAGSFVTTVRGSEPEVTGAVLRLDRSRLLLPLWSGPGAQFVPGQSAAAAVSFIVPGVPDSNRAYALTPGGLRPIRGQQRVTGGVRVTIEEFALNSLVLLTEDPLTVGSLTRRAASVARRAAELQRRLAGRKLEIARQVARRMAGRPPSVWNEGGLLTTARRHLQSCDGALAGRDYQAACRNAERAMRPLRVLERTNWTAAIRSLRSPVSSPATVCFSTLPWHWSLVDRAGSWQPEPNRLPAGDFEKLEAMQAAGWHHFQHATAGVHVQANLIPEAAHSGRAGLRLLATSAAPEAPPTLVETPPIWIITPAVPVQAGSLVRIQGWVHVPVAITGSVDGLLIFDSLSGEALAERIGETTGWQPFTLYRIATHTGPMTVTFALSGVGEAWIDDVTIQTLRPKRL